MSSKVTPSLSSSSSLSSQQAVQNPQITIGAPFDRNQTRWIPLSITVGPEKCEIESTFASADTSNGPNDVQVHTLNGATIVGRIDPIQIVVCVPYGQESGKKPETFLDFQELVKKTLDSLLPGTTATLNPEDISEVEVPNRAYFALQIYIEPTSTITIIPIEKDGAIRGCRKEKHESAGNAIRAYATQHALYILSNKIVSLMGVEDAISDAQPFLSSFKIT